MKKSDKNKILIRIAIIIGLVVIFYFATRAITHYTGHAVSDSSIDIGTFTKCLSDKGVKMYGAYWCPHCQNQKSLFGQGVLESSGVYVECDPSGSNSEAQLCTQMSITGYPTWIIKGNRYEGELSLSRISQLSGCKLN